MAFVYAGDIWTVGANGGEARRLTSHEGLELFPKISPDGKWIAFSGEYSGSRQIFVIPAEGGTPRQLTWYNSVGVMPPRGGYDHVVLDWTPDSRQILIRANRTTFGERNGKYFLVPLDGGLEKPLQIVNGGFAAFSPDGSKLVFTPVDREFRTWKRYKGGRASDLWIFDLKKNTSEQITDFKGTDQHPVWWGDEIFFASDRDLKLNIWKYNVKTRETSQVTTHKEFDVMWPSGSNGWLVYENGGYLYKLNLASGTETKLTIHVRFDNPNLLPYWKNVKDDIHSFAISPSGKRALFDARGDIFSVPAENGILENLTQTQGIREIFPTWSPDGAIVAYSSSSWGDGITRLGIVHDIFGKNQDWIRFDNTEIRGEYPFWMADGRIVYSGCDFATGGEKCGLYWVGAGGGNYQQLTNHYSDTAPAGHGTRVAFMSARDGNWEVYSVGMEGGAAKRLTNNEAQDGLPTWSPDGRSIAFVSNRGGAWAIWVMTADGGNQQKLFDLGGGYGGGEFEWTRERISWAP